jgi:peptide-methionine (S)-S-oxide reductase|tara:strand:+ start:430 stop:1020 length:591 start_codon:yes stop_codon:yes gene_type:complete
MDREDIIKVNEFHYVTKRNIKKYDVENYCDILLGLGCFWGAERLFWELPYVYVTSVGYGGGQTKNPTYQDICSGRTMHAELVKVIFENKESNLRNILKVFFENHDPTQGMRQGNDIGSQYRSCIFSNNESHYKIAIELLNKYQNILEINKFKKVITTEVKMDTDFYYAEDYHQQYLAKNPQGYCGIQGLGFSIDID